MRVLVYGSLKKGFWNNRLLSHSRFIRSGEFKVHGCQLKANEDSPFPYLFKKFNQRALPFHGELYEINEETLEDLDYLEGHPSFYQRIFVKEYDCYVYTCGSEDLTDMPTIYKFLNT